MLTVAQTTTQDTSSSALLVFAMLVLIGVVSVLALTARGQRALLPAVAILLGSVVSFTTISDGFAHRFSILTVIGLFVGVTLLFGGFGALRDGVALPPVEGRDPEIAPQPPRVTPDGAPPPPPSQPDV